MKKNTPEEHFEKVLQTLIADAGLDSRTVTEVAESPQTWWAVQREIAAEKVRTRSPWPPSIAWKRWLLLGLPAATAALVVIAFLGVQRGPNFEDVASVIPPEQENTALETSPQVPVSAPRPLRLARSSGSASLRTVSRRAYKEKAGAAAVDNARQPEVKTDFIALGYGRDPESGQIVRVQVPRSMMVNLGLVSSIEKPASMVDAEILVGDDGRTHAIRFIRQ